MRLSVLVVIAWSAFLANRIAGAQPAAAVASPREGRIAISSGSVNGAPSSGVGAVFANAPAWGAVIASDGPCTLRRHISAAQLSAGTIEITGTTSPLTLEAPQKGVSAGYKLSASLPTPAFVEGASIRVEAKGGPDIGAFSATVTAPVPLTGYEPPRELSRNGYSAAWTAVSGTEVMLVLVATNPAISQGVVLVCRVPDAGGFTIPASTFALIPRAFSAVILNVSRVAETIQIVDNFTIMFDAVEGVGTGPYTLPAPVPDPRLDGEHSVAQPHPLPVLHPTHDPRENNSPRIFFGVAFGNGGASRIGDAPPFRDFGGRLQLGQRLQLGLHLVEELTNVWSNAANSFSEEQTSYAVGVRFAPFSPQPHRSQSILGLLPGPIIDAHSFYAAAVVGAAFRDRMTSGSATPTEETAWSPMASVALGILEFQGRDWSLGLEFREQLAHFDGHFQHSWLLLIPVHLNEW